MHKFKFCTIACDKIARRRGSPTRRDTAPQKNSLHKKEKRASVLEEEFKLDVYRTGFESLEIALCVPSFI